MFKKVNTEEEKQQALDFYTDLFHTPPKDAISFQGIQPADKRYAMFKPLEEILNTASSALYVNTSSIGGTITEKGLMSRKNEDCVALHAIVFDDIGTKVPVSRIKCEPSYKIETSKGNYQYVYILDEPITNFTYAERVLRSIHTHRPALSDLAAVSTYNRLFRFPLGIHGKSTDKTDEEYNFPVRISYKADPMQFFNPLELLAELGVSLIAEQSAQAEGVVNTDDPLLDWLQSTDFIKSDQTNDQTWYKVQCPRHDEHTEKLDFDANYSPLNKGLAGRQFKCHHEHAGMPPDTQDFLDWCETQGGPHVTLHDERRLQRSDSGKIIPTLTNAIILVERLKHSIKYNEFMCQTFIDDIKITDSNIISLRVDIADQYGAQFTSMMISDAVEYIAQQNKYHPVRELIESTMWDGQERAADIFIKYQYANNTELNQELTKRWLLGVMYRIYRPGTKFDHALFLTGAEGTGKSSMWQALAMRQDWFGELQTTDPKLVVEATTGKIIIELTEGIVAEKRSQNEVKAMLSCSSIALRKAYGRYTENHLMTCCYAGCHNSHEFLRDSEGTGLRRFWTMPIHRKALDTYNWKTFISEVPQIWAEVKTWYDAGEEPELPEHLIKDLNEQRTDATLQDDWERDILNFLDGLYDASQNKVTEKMGNDTPTPKDLVCIKMIVVEALGLEYNQISQANSKRIANIMNKQANWKYRKYTVRIPGYGPQRCWQRI